MKSKNYKYWSSLLEDNPCNECKELHGNIYGIYEIPIPRSPLHPFCRCSIKILDAIRAGKATQKGNDGADWWLKYVGELPSYYIEYDKIRALGWEMGESPSMYAPGKMIVKGIYRNKNRHLPHIEGRIWYEADIDYTGGRRKDRRILWSNDGLIFVTYDHYYTFKEIF